MPSLSLPRALTAAAALALALAAAVPLPAAAQELGYYGMRYGSGQTMTAPSGRIWGAQPSGGNAARAGLPTAGLGMSQAMGRYDPYGNDPFGNAQVQDPVPRTAVGAAAQGLMPKPGAGTTRPGAMGGAGAMSPAGMTAAPVLTPSPYGMQLQQPNRANLRVDNRVSLGTANGSGGAAGGN